MTDDQFNPTITPLLDLSYVEQGLSSIDGMFAEERSAKLAMSGYGSAGLGKVVNQTFTQYNTSPKSLSKLEIYRQTRNQFAVMKEAMSKA